MPRGRSIPRLTLAAEEAQTLEGWRRRHTTAQALSRRAHVVLLAAQGKSNVEVAELCGLSRVTVGKWRHRFVEGRVDALLDEPRPGAPRRVTDADVERVITKTL